MLRNQGGKVTPVCDLRRFLAERESVLLRPISGFLVISKWFVLPAHDRLDEQNQADDRKNCIDEELKSLGVHAPVHHPSDKHRDDNSG